MKLLPRSSGIGESGLLFDNLVVTTSILIFQPVEDWSRVREAGLPSDLGRVGHKC